MKLPQAEADLETLKRYLTKNHGMGSAVRGIRLRTDQECNSRNRRDPRSFGFTIPRSKVIRCADVLEVVGANMRVGILLHEILHIALPAFGDNAEIKVDEFATTDLKETGYHYADQSYWVFVEGQFRQFKAKAIECVSERFLKRLEQYRR